MASQNRRCKLIKNYILGDGDSSAAGNTHPSTAHYGTVCAVSTKKTSLGLEKSGSRFSGRSRDLSDDSMEEDQQTDREFEKPLIQ
jgi:hypothetical protein